MVCSICMFAAMVCFAYCLTVFRIHSGSRFYMIWGLGGLIFIGLACMVHFGWWSLLPSVFRKIVTALVVMAVSFFVIIEGCIFSQYRAKGEPDLDYIIVLGAQMKESGPSIVLKFRLDTAYDYLMENENTLCIVSGGQGRNEPCSEAEGMYRYLTDKGIAAERILMEDQSTDTSENIAFSAKLVGNRQEADVGIVTNNFHVFRGIHLARKWEFRSVCGISAPSALPFQPNNLFREFFGVLKDLFCGNLA